MTSDKHVDIVVCEICGKRMYRSRDQQDRICRDCLMKKIKGG